MSSFHILTRRERGLGAGLALVACASVVSAVVLVFADAGRTPWFDAASELAQAAERCRQAPSSSSRHECLRRVAAGEPVRLASTQPKPKQQP
jgi:hypothetical protein